MYGFSFAVFLGTICIVVYIYITSREVLKIAFSVTGFVLIMGPRGLQLFWKLEVVLATSCRVSPFHLSWIAHQLLELFLHFYKGFSC